MGLSCTWNNRPESGLRTFSFTDMLRFLNCNFSIQNCEVFKNHFVQYTIIREVITDGTPLHQTRPNYLRPTTTLAFTDWHFRFSDIVYLKIFRWRWRVATRLHRHVKNCRIRIYGSAGTV